MKIKDGDVFMVRGDDEYMTVEMLEDGETRAFVSGDTLTMTVRTRVPQTFPTYGTSAFSVAGTFDSATGSMLVSIPAAKTKSLSYGFDEYVYDLQATLKSGGITTIQPEARFVLLREVTV